VSSWKKLPDITTKQKEYGARTRMPGPRQNRNNSAESIEQLNVEQIELKGFSRSVAELEWLLLILVLLYYIAPDTYIEDSTQLVLAMVSFAAFVLAFRYCNFFTIEKHWKIAVETWVMIGFITWVLVYTGGTESLLLNLYLLVIITSALALGKLATLLEFALITCIYLYLGYSGLGQPEFAFADFTALMIKFAPFLLVAYLITMMASDLHFARSMFKFLSETDDLTGLLNMRAFNKSIAHEITKAERYKRPFCIMIIDADTFKTVNDKFGHDAGDKSIQDIGRTIRNSLRDTDILARYGGDEYIAFLPETGSGAAHEVGERLRKSVESMAFHVNAAAVPITVSVGIANYPDDTPNPNYVIELADRALYHSKQQGRNQVTLFSELKAKSAAEPA
jgi:diguanylate cyclase (GGDEF)-like protein